MIEHAPAPIGTRRRHRRTVWVAVSAALLAAVGCIVTPGDPGAVDVRLTVDLFDGAGRPISPLIYGSNNPRGLATNRQSVVRLGGNRWTAYNWENNASNAGSDWLFQNDNHLSPSDSPAAAVVPTIDQAQANGAAVVVTVPIVDHVSADKNGGGDVRNSGPNYLSTRFRQNRSTKGSAFSANPDSTDGFVYQDEFVNWLKTNRGGADILFSLDNEPDLWSHTHAEVHPQKLTYQELIDRNKDYAAAIKRVWPSALVTGPVNYGYNGFISLQDAPDKQKGDFLEVYLRELAAAEAAAGGTRLVDLLDVHWYPEASGNGVRVTNADTSDAVVAARVQAPRSLWDPSYVETSWITNAFPGAINLLPKLRAKIDRYRPGTGLAVTEWNYGGGNHISGAVATADVLGVFGREGVQLANLWELNGEEPFTYAAFRAFRNYDGQGATFGDRSRAATSSDNVTASVYASTFSADVSKAVIVVINKATTPKTAGVTLRGLPTYKSAKMYTISGAGGANVVAQPDIRPVATNAFRPSLPGLSVSVIVPQL
jgi:hypothetical protein